MTQLPRRTLGATWWLSSGAYFRVMVREFSAFAVAAYLVTFIMLLYRLTQGETAFTAYMEFLRSGPMLIFHGVVMAFALWHTITWFNLTPKAMPVRIGEDKVHPALIAGPNYVLWVIVSAGVIYLVMR